jgi:hypothetical protein
MDRWLAGVLALVLGANGLVQLIAPFWWYGVVPGVPLTGAYNPHFVRDIGAAYLVAAGGLAWFAAKPTAGWPALAAGVGFLSLHAGIHLFDASCSASPIPALIRDFPGVYLPALISAAIAVLRRPHWKES